MNQDHDEIKSLIPEYLNGSLPKADLERLRVHLEGCGECKEELHFIRDIASVDVPDPGNLFWRTLPGRVMEKREKGISGLPMRLFALRPLGMATAFVFLVVVTFMVIKKKETQGELFFQDPLISTMEYQDYNGLTEKDIPSVADEIAGNDLGISDTDFSGQGYYTQVASLNAEDIANLDNALKRQK